MTTTLTKEDRLSRVLRASGLKKNWHIHGSPEGWLALRGPFGLTAGQDALAVHGDWAGPVKLAERQGEVEQRVEFFLGSQPGTTDSSAFDEEAAQEAEHRMAALLHLAQQLDGRSRLDGWQPPAAETLAGWLADAGHENAIDSDKNLRLTLKRRGCDGQVRVERGDGRLRLILPLGAWPELNELSRVAMRGLLGIANARSRLVRLAWLPEGAGRCCEAQVDLSGLPNGDGCDGLWRATLPLAVGALELALRQLGLELPLLADPNNHELAELVRSRT
jgi:hypothetical protein